MKDRIVKLMESLQMNQQNFSNYVGVNAATLNSIIKERTRPTLTVVEAICSKMTNVNMSWLVTGEGNMFIDDSESKRIVEPQLPFDEQLDASYGQKDDLEQRTDYSAKNTSSNETYSSNNTIAGMALRQQRGGQQQDAKGQLNAKNIDTRPRRITEIRVFYDDQTWESFVPKR